ncbi:MAG: hypothetical protein A2Y10_13150 [Planctomycetes bacterium GWF2_41_51]|nr:MAG: hypothetical protein A2Y10_13150 [Planctomycetes bacterium GWF2_41_51]HBG60696.1 hypothetical protein [Candidatus Omnitrophota bacterium]
MEKQIQEIDDYSTVKITRAAMEEELGDDYKKCWAFAFKYATEELDFDMQAENLCREFDLIKSQGQWFVKGANAILFKKEATEIRQTIQENSSSKKNKQSELADFSQAKTKPTENYVSQLEMMSFLEDVEEMCNDTDFSEFWEELGKIKQKVQEQYCATDKEVLAIFKIRTMVDRAKEENERFFDAYPLSTDAWENGHFDIAGEIIFN